MIIGGVLRFGHSTEYMRDVLHCLPIQQRIHCKISSIVWHCYPKMYLVIILSSSSLRSASRGDFLMHMLALPPERKGLSRSCLDCLPLGLTCVLCHGTGLALFINWIGSASEELP